MATTTKIGLLAPFHSHIRDEFPLSHSTSLLPKLTNSPFSQFSSTVKQSRNAPILPLINAQSSPDYIPDAKFYKVEAILSSFCEDELVQFSISHSIFPFCCWIRTRNWPWRVSKVSSFLMCEDLALKVVQQRDRVAQSFLKFGAKVKMEIVVSKDQVEAVIEKIIEEARTGEIGDGNIFLTPFSDLIRARTGERREKAERMTGGRSDMTSV